MMQLIDDCRAKLNEFGRYTPDRPPAPPGAYVSTWATPWDRWNHGTNGMRWRSEQMADELINSSQLIGFPFRD